MGPEKIEFRKIPSILMACLGQIYISNNCQLLWFCSSQKMLISQGKSQGGINRLGITAITFYG